MCIGRLGSLPTLYEISLQLDQSQVQTRMAKKRSPMYVPPQRAKKEGIKAKSVWKFVFVPQQQLEDQNTSIVKKVLNQFLQEKSEILFFTKSRIILPHAAHGRIGNQVRVITKTKTLEECQHLKRKASHKYYAYSNRTCIFQGLPRTSGTPFSLQRVQKCLLLCCQNGLHCPGTYFTDIKQHTFLYINVACGLENPVLSTEMKNVSNQHCSTVSASQEVGRKLSKSLPSTHQTKEYLCNNIHNFFISLKN